MQRVASGRASEGLIYSVGTEKRSEVYAHVEAETHHSRPRSRPPSQRFPKLSTPQKVRPCDRDGLDPFNPNHVLGLLAVLGKGPCSGNHQRERCDRNRLAVFILHGEVVYEVGASCSPIASLGSRCSQGTEARRRVMPGSDSTVNSPSTPSMRCCIVLMPRPWREIS